MSPLFSLKKEKGKAVLHSLNLCFIKKGASKNHVLLETSRGVKQGEMISFFHLQASCRDLGLPIPPDIGTERIFQLHDWLVEQIQQAEIMQRELWFLLILHIRDEETALYYIKRFFIAK